MTMPLVLVCWLYAILSLSFAAGIEKATGRSKGWGEYLFSCILGLCWPLLVLWRVWYALGYWIVNRPPRLP